METRLISASAAQDLDTRSRTHIPALLLMEDAAGHIASIVRSLAAPLSHPKIVFLAGPGNNGGDALAAQRILASGGMGSLFILVAEPKTDLCRIQREALEPFSPLVSQASDPAGALAEADIIVDGIFGVGLTRPLEGNADVAVARANASRRAKRIAIDVPSGIGDEVARSRCFKADVTVTMGFPKACLFHPSAVGNAGEIRVVNPGFPPREIGKTPVVAELVDDAAAPKPPAFRDDAYKKTRGHLAVFAGSREYTGAARLASRSAFHAGAGLVTLFADSASYFVAAAESPSVMVRHLEDGFDLSRYDAVLAGPGWGAGREELLGKLLKGDRPLVIDADGIRALAHLWEKGTRPEGRIVVTPHVGEASILSRAVLGRDIMDDEPLAFYSDLKAMADSLGAVILLKSAVNHIADGESVRVVDGRNPSLGVAGSGDVLSGIVGAYLAAGMDCKDAAVAAAAAHQKAGRRLYYTSEELIGGIR